MSQIKIISYPNHNQQTFLLVKPSSKYYQVGEKYMFTDYENQNFLFIKYLVHKKTITVKNITPEISFLDKNCTPTIYIDILRQIFKMSSDDTIDVMTFTDKSNFKPFDV